MPFKSIIKYTTYGAHVLLCQEVFGEQKTKNLLMRAYLLCLLLYLVANERIFGSYARSIHEEIILNKNSVRILSFSFCIFITVTEFNLLHKHILFFQFRSLENSMLFSSILTTRKEKNCIVN